MSALDFMQGNRTAKVQRKEIIDRNEDTVKQKQQVNLKKEEQKKQNREHE